MASFSTAFLNHPNLWDVYDWPDDFQDELDFMADELDIIRKYILKTLKCHELFFYVLLFFDIVDYSSAGFIYFRSKNGPINLF